MLLATGGGEHGQQLSRQLAERLPSSLLVASDPSEVRAWLEAAEPPRAVLVDFDELASDVADEMVALSIAAAMPTLVWASCWDVELRERLQVQGIVDYYLEDGGIAEVLGMLERLQRNPLTKVLVVDDSRLFRRAVSKLLLAHRFTVLEAVDGLDGLRVLQAEPELRLVLTDYEMPGLDGVELVRRMRALRGRDELAIIGLSTVGGTLTPQFLKHGADDFLSKPFEREEFYCRIYRSLETVEHIQAIQRAAFTDQLTGLANRLAFFRRAPLLHGAALDQGQNLSVAMIDIDHFKAINDTYGHAGGDVALRSMARLLEAELSAFEVCARFGGEEFCVVAAEASWQEAQAQLETLRRAVEASSVIYEGQTIRFTISIGAVGTLLPRLDAMINRADELLYRAKEGGRNRLVVV